MVVFDEKQHRCRLCGNYYSDSDMSEEHYPARNTGNEDVVAVDLGKMFDTFTSESVHAEIREKLNHGETLENITGDIFDTQLSTSLFPKGRTARTLCRKCNTFLWAIFIRKTHKPLFCCGHQPTASWELSSIYSAIRRNSSAYLNFTLMFPPS